MNSLDPEKELKEELLEICVALQEEKIANARTAMEEAKKALEDDEGVFSDRDDDFREQRESELEMFSQRFRAAGRELLVLENMNLNRPFDSVQLGAMVETDQRRFFISIGLGPVKLEGETYVCISTEAPLYAPMKNAKTGESFEFRGTEYHIEKIY